MKNYNIYGYKSGCDLESARLSVENALGIKLSAHESSYHCGDYYRCGNSGAEHFILQYNHDDIEDDWCEPAYQSSLLLLYVNETFRSADLEKKLIADGEFKLLRHEEL